MGTIIRSEQESEGWFRGSPENEEVARFVSGLQNQRTFFRRVHENGGGMVVMVAILKSNKKSRKGHLTSKCILHPFRCYHDIYYSITAFSIYWTKNWGRGGTMCMFPLPHTTLHMVCGSFQNTMHKFINTGSLKERTNLRNDNIYVGLGGMVMVFNVTFNNIWVIPWRPLRKATTVR